MKLTGKHLMTIGVAIFATTLSYAINYHLNLGPLNGGKASGPVVAASTVGIIGALFFKEYAVTSYIAAFAGMSSLTVIPSVYYAPIFGLMAGIFAILFAKLFVGFGGKAGTTSFCSVLMTLGLSTVFGFSPQSVNSYFRLPTTNDFDPLWIVSAVAAGVWGILGTILLREKVLQKRKAPNEVVLGPAIAGLATALVLPWVIPSMAAKIAAVVASGTYAGMVSRKILASNTYMALAGVLVGLLNVSLATIFMGVGGKLGFMGLLSIAFFHYLESHGRNIHASVDAVKTTQIGK